MLRTRILILLLAAALIIVLFKLPRVVVDNTEDNSQSPSAQILPVPGTENEFNHDQELQPQDKDRILALRASIESNDNQEKSIIFADSLGELYLGYQKFDSAATYFERAANISQKAEAWVKAGNAYYEAFTFAIDPEEASYFGTKVRECFEPVLAMEPDRLDLKNKIGMTLVSSSNPMLGITMLREVLEKDPGNEDVLYNLGILAFQTGQYDVAIERFERLVTVSEENVQGHFYLGLSYRETGDSEKAREQLEIVKELDLSPDVQATVDSYLKEINN